MKYAAWLFVAAFVGLVIMTVGCSGADEATAPPDNSQPPPNVQITVGGVCVAAHAGHEPGFKYVSGLPYTSASSLVIAGDGDQAFVLLPGHYTHGTAMSLDQRFRQQYIAYPGEFTCNFWTSIYTTEGQLLNKRSCSTSNTQQSCTVHVEAAYP